MIDKLNKAQIAFGIVAGLYAVWCYYNYLGTTLIAVPFTYVMLPVWAFTGGIHARGIVERGQANSFLKFMYAPLVIFVLAVDIVWNATIAIGIYKELPKEWLFTTRTKRHLNYSRGFRNDRALYWAGVLNAIHPGHI